MKMRQPFFRRPGYQGGVSLIEILVSLVIGLFVVGAVLTNYVGTGLAGVQQNATSQMTEDAQIAFTVMTRDIQMAGYTDVTSVVATSGGGTAMFARPSIPRGIFGCENSFVTATAAFAAATCVAGTASHSIELSFQATTATSVLTSAGTTADCLGNALAGTTSTFTSNRYYVSSAGGRPELYCASQDATGSGGQPIVENVESMRIWYGIAPNWSPSNPASRQPTRYVTATQIAGVPAVSNDIVSVRLCLLMRSSDAVLSNEDVQTYSDCTGATATSTDRRLRRAFFSTIALRNKMGI